MNIIGDSAHNFIDGVIIASTYAVDIRLGIATTIAVLLHEIPQEIGDFGVLLNAKWSLNRIIMVNFMSALISFVGVFFVLFFGNYSQEFLTIVTPISAGGLIYIACSDLIPDLHHKEKTAFSATIVQILVILLGVLVMAFLK
jgi:zinc and cadmium transporter